MLITDVISGKKVERTPLWMMRQAGRYLPEYKKVRADFPSFMDFCYTPKAACEVTLQPISRFDFDAAIIFSDILVIPDALGQKVSFRPDHGPVLNEFSFARLEKKLSDRFFDHLSPVYDAITMTKQSLSVEKALYGFAGSPWTLACYMVEEGKSDTFSKIHHFSKDPTFLDFIDFLVEAVARHLIHQIDAGADVVQLFDSWAGIVDASNEDDFLINPALKVMKKVHEKHPKTPFVYYARSKSPLLLQFSSKIREYEHPIALGVHQDVDLDDLSGVHVALQGNLCPEILCHGGRPLDVAIEEIFSKMQGRSHIFNLGHGILKETPLEHVHTLVNAVRGYRKAA